MKPFQAEKKQRLKASAVRLFMEKGIRETSVNDIVKDAGLAKGTFYVYYQDKAALIHEIMERKHLSITETLIVQAKADVNEHTSWSVSFMRHLIHFFQENPHVLKLLHHLFSHEEKSMLSLSLMNQKIPCFSEFIASFQENGESAEDAYKRFMILMEMCSVICYNALFHHQPDCLENITDMFERMISQCLSQCRGVKI